MFRLRFCVTAHRIQHLKYIKISIALDLDFRFFQRGVCTPVGVLLGMCQQQQQLSENASHILAFSSATQSYPNNRFPNGVRGLLKLEQAI